MKQPAEGALEVGHLDDGDLAGHPEPRHGRWSRGIGTCGAEQQRNDDGNGGQGRPTDAGHGAIVTFRVPMKPGEDREQGGRGIHHDAQCAELLHHERLVGEKAQTEHTAHRRDRQQVLVAPFMTEQGDSEYPHVRDEADGGLGDAQNVGERRGSHGIASGPCFTKRWQWARVVVQERRARGQHDEHERPNDDQCGGATHVKGDLYSLGHLASVAPQFLSEMDAVQVGPRSRRRSKRRR